MRNPKNIRHLFFLFIAFASLLSCNTNDDGLPPAEDSIAEIVANSPQFSTLKTALERTGLETSLQASGSLTLFAPTDAAFDLFLATANFASIEDVPEDVLENLLLNHVLAARVDESILRALGKNYTETMAVGPVANKKLTLFFDATESKIVLNGISDITEADIRATNGIIHVVDAVIDFPTLATFVKSNDGFSKLTQALTTATPATDFMATLSGSAQYTLFAPADVAFDALLDTNPDWTTVDDIEEGLLTSVLQHHVVSGIIRSSDINDDDTATTLEGDLITFSTANGGIDITDGEGNDGITVVVADLQAINGVLHAIDEVLIPDTTN